jgi:hypothetical protein
LKEIGSLTIKRWLNSFYQPTSVTWSWMIMISINQEQSLIVWGWIDNI